MLRATTLACLRPRPVFSLLDPTPMAQPSLPYQLFVGVDIAAKTFAAVWISDTRSFPRAVSFEQTPEGFLAFQQRLQDFGIAPVHTLLVAEATGSYWVSWAVSMHQAGYTVAI